MSLSGYLRGRLILLRKGMLRVMREGTRRWKTGKYSSMETFQAWVLCSCTAATALRMPSGVYFVIYTDKCFNERKVTDIFFWSMLNLACGLWFSKRGLRWRIMQNEVMDYTGTVKLDTWKTYADCLYKKISALKRLSVVPYYCLVICL